MASVVSRAVLSIYDCATDLALWPKTLQRIADCFGDVGALLLHRTDAGSFVTVVSPSLEACAEAYARQWWRCDIRATRSMDYAYAEAAGAITDRHFITDEEIATHPIYTQFLAPFGLRWGAGVQLSPGTGSQVSLTIQRAASKPPFRDDDLDLLTELGRHVEQSLRLGLRLIDAEAIQHGLGAALDRLAVAAAVVDRDAVLRFRNRHSGTLFGSRLLMRGGRLACRSPEVQHRLTAAIAAGCRAGSDFGPERMQVEPIVMTDDGDPVVLYVIPALGPSSTWSTLAEPLCVVLAVDLARGAPLDPGLVRDVYGLTLGEARIASLVGSGIGPSDVADRLNLSRETVRSVLKRVFEKLDVTRQAELVDLFTRLKATSRRPGSPPSP